MSQLKSELSEFIDYFTKYSNDLSSRFNISSISTQQQQQSQELYDLSEEFINLNEHFLINDSYDHNELLEEQEIKKTLNKLSSFCSNCLSKVTFEQLLGNKFFKSSHFIVFSVIRCLLIRIHQSSDQNEIKQNLIESFNIIEIIIDYLNNLNNNKNLKLETIDLFLLSILNSISNIFYFLHTNDNYDTNCDQMSIIKTDLIKKSTQILNKITILVEIKLVDLSDPTNYGNQVSINKFCKHLIYIINNLKEARSVVSIWKILTKLIFKNKQFTIDPNMVSKSNQDKRFLINKIYLILDNEIISNLKSIKLSLIKISNGENRDDSNSINTSANISSTNTQLTSTNNIIQDTLKLIKLTGFFFKIFNSLVTKHLNILIADYENKYFILMTNFFSSLLSIIFLDTKTDIELLTADDETRATNDYEEKVKKINKCKTQFCQVKNEFIKEFVLNTKTGSIESILNLFLSNLDYFNYLTNNDQYLENMIKTMVENSSLSQYDNATQFQTQQLIDSNSNKQYDYTSIEDYLIFYLVYLNKLDYGLIKDSLNLKMLLDNLFNMLDICVISLNLPNYLSFYEVLHSKSYDFTSLAGCITNNIKESIEFYDFVLLTSTHLVTRLLAASRSDDFDNDLYVYLVENLKFDQDKFSLKKTEQVEQLYKIYPIRIQFSSDLLSLISINLTKSSTTNLSNFLKFICDVIEIKNGYSNVINDYDMIYINNLSDILIQIIENNISNNNKPKLVLSNLEDYIKSNKLYYCFSLLANYFNSSDFAYNIFTTLIDLYRNLIELISDFGKTSSKKNEQLLIKKTIAFIEAKYFQQCLRIAINLIDSTNLKNTGNNQINMVKNQLGKSLINFFKLNELNNLFKYFENINNNSKLNFDYYKMLYLFICDSIHLYSLIATSITDNSNDNDMLFFIEFLSNKYSVFKCDISNLDTLIKQKSNSLLNNFKFQSIFLLKKLASKKIENRLIFDNIIKLFVLLLNDSSDFIKYFTFECLNEFTIDGTNNKLFVELRKQSDSNLKCLIDNFVLRQPIFSQNINDLAIINQRFINFVEFKYKISENKNDNEDLIEPMDHHNASLNDTINLIMSAMDTTISCSLKPNGSSNIDNISYSPKIDDGDNDDQDFSNEDDGFDNDFDEIFKKTRQDSVRLIEIYEKKSKPIHVKKKIQDLIKYLSESI